MPGPLREIQPWKTRHPWGRESKPTMTTPTLSSKRGNLLGLIRLTRPKNLLIAAGAMVVMRQGWMARWASPPADIHVTNADFLNGVTVLVLLMAAGNLINAYFDVHEDRINRPDRALVDRTVKRRVLIVAHQVLNLTGLALAAHLSWSLSTLTPFLLAVLVSFVMWNYSARWKSTTWLGNVAVAALLGLVPIWLLILESPQSTAAQVQSMWLNLGGYGAMALGIGFVRELVKDAQDTEGDQQAGKRTFPLSHGFKKTRRLALVVLVLVAFAYVAALAFSFDGLLDPQKVLWLTPVPSWMASVLLLARKNTNWPALSKALLTLLIAGVIQCLWIPEVVL